MESSRISVLTLAYEGETSGNCALCGGSGMVSKARVMGSDLVFLICGKCAAVPADPVAALEPVDPEGDGEDQTEG